MFASTLSILKIADSRTYALSKYQASDERSICLRRSCIPMNGSVSGKAKPQVLVKALDITDTDCNVLK